MNKEYTGKSELNFPVENVHAKIYEIYEYIYGNFQRVKEYYKVIIQF